MALAALPALPDRGASYDVGPRIGGGALTEVVLALARGPFGFERPVVLVRPLAGLSALAAVEAAHAIAREAHAHARVTHPAIIRLYAFEMIDRRPTLVLEHVDGLSLDHLTVLLESRGEAIDEAAALFVGYRLFLALAAAHDARAPVIPGDVRPANILVPWDGHVKLSGVRTDAHAGCLVLRELLVRSARLTKPPASVVAALDRGLAQDPRRRTLSAEEMVRIIRRVLDVEAARELLVDRMASLRHGEERPPPESMVVPARRLAARPGPNLYLRAGAIGVTVGVACSSALLMLRAHVQRPAREAARDAAVDAAVTAPTASVAPRYGVTR